MTLEGIPYNRSLFLCFFVVCSFSPARGHSRSLCTTDRRDAELSMLEQQRGENPWGKRCASLARLMQPTATMRRKELARLDAVRLGCRSPKKG